MEIKDIKFGIQETCRVCLQTYSEMCQIFREGSGYEKILRECGRVEVEENDGLPVVMCEYCVQEMTQAHHFLTKCQDADRRLRLALLTHVKGEISRNDDSSDSLIMNVKHEEYLLNSIKEEPINFANSPQSNVFQAEPKYNKINHKQSSRKKERKNASSVFFPKKCSECNYVAKCKSVMIIHTRTHTKEKPFLCSLCGKSLKTNDGLKAHFLRTHSQDKRAMQFKCDTCEKRFYRRKDLVVHIRIHTGETPYSCKHCPKSFAQVTSLVRHTRTHTGDKPFKCTICSKSFSCSSGLGKHQVVHTDERKFSCSQCGTLFKTKASLTQHIIVHTNPMELVCDQCGMSFNKRGNLMLHIKRMHSENSGQCCYCKKRFSKLSEHLIVHTSEKPFECDICNKRFNRKGSLRLHVTKHFNVKKFPCQAEGCSKTFPMQCMLLFHELKFHKKQTPYVCKYCRKGFFRPCDLNKHLRVYHSDQPDMDIIKAKNKYIV